MVFGLARTPPKHRRVRILSSPDGDWRRALLRVSRLSASNVLVPQSAPLTRPPRLAPPTRRQWRSSRRLQPKLQLVLHPLAALGGGAQTDDDCSRVPLQHSARQDSFGYDSVKGTVKVQKSHYSVKHNPRLYEDSLSTFLTILPGSQAVSDAL